MCHSNSAVGKHGNPAGLISSEFVYSEVKNPEITRFKSSRRYQTFLSLIQLTFILISMNEKEKKITEKIKNWWERHEKLRKWYGKRELRIRFFTALAIMVILVGGAIPFAFHKVPLWKYSDSDWDDYILEPLEPSYNHTQWNILLDAHSHSDASYDGIITPRQNIKWHIAMGFNAMVLTDHNTFDNVEEAKRIAREEFNDTIKVFTGVEWTTSRIHMNIILPPNVTSVQYNTLISDKDPLQTPSDVEIQDFIQAVHELGGVVTVNHYIYSETIEATNLPSRLQLYEWGIDYIEIVNRNTYDSVSEDFCSNYSLGMITGTDMHVPEAVYCWTTLNASEFTEEAIFAEIKARRTGFIFDSKSTGYPFVHSKTAYYIIAYPLAILGEVLRDIWQQENKFWIVVTIIFYFVVLWFMGEIVMFLIFLLKVGGKKIGKKGLQKISKRTSSSKEKTIEE